MAHNARRKCLKNNYGGIHDCSQRDPICRVSQLIICLTEEKCIAMDKLAQEDHSHRLSNDEYETYQKQWYLTLNKSGTNVPIGLRSDFRTAVTMMKRLHRESGEEPISFQQYQRWHPSSSSSSWWNWMVPLRRMAICCTNDGRCKQYASHVTFFLVHSAHL